MKVLLEELIEKLNIYLKTIFRLTLISSNNLKVYIELFKPYTKKYNNNKINQT